MKLNEYVLQEKVSKSERRSVLTDPKVKIGVEIEFRIPGNRSAGRAEIMEKIKKLGINDIREFGYHGGASYSGWRLETDISAGEELISPPLPAPTFVKLMPKIFKIIKDAGGEAFHSGSGHGTGMHMNISIDGLNVRDDLDSFKLALFTDEDKIFKMMPERYGRQSTSERIGNLNKEDEGFKSTTSNFYSYTRSVMSFVIRNLIDKPASSLDDIMNKLTKDTGRMNVEPIQELNSLLPYHKYFGINFTRKQNNYIEFRYPGGKNYLNEWKKMLDLAGMLSFNLKLGLDRDYKAKEYWQRKVKLVKKIIEIKQATAPPADNGIKSITFKNIKLRSPELQARYIKAKYSWFMDADIENAVLEVNEKGKLIWKSGTWKNGTWKDGFWLSGDFVGGTWEKGTFHNGTFQNATWQKGTFNKGTFKNAHWNEGKFNNGRFENSTWDDGTWNDGIFENSTWNEGTWNTGTWMNGIWNNGLWKNGLWMVGIWNNGLWMKGTWLNGTWNNGTWKSGTWKKGINYEGENTVHAPSEWTREPEPEPAVEAGNIVMPSGEY